MLEHDPSDKSVDVHVAASSANVSFDDRMIDDDINNGANEMVDDARRVASERLLLLGIVLLADLHRRSKVDRLVLGVLCFIGCWVLACFV